MAGDWIKFEMSTLAKPEVLKLARLTGLDRYGVVGRLLEFWAWADLNAVDGVVDGVVDGDVDALVDAPGFAKALQTVLWITLDPKRERLVITNFDRHNGKSAKNRALKADRQKKWRSKTVDGGVDGGASTREEKRIYPPKSPTARGTSRRQKSTGEDDQNHNGRARVQIENTRGPEQLARIVARLGLGLVPAGMDFSEGKQWALRKI